MGKRVSVIIPGRCEQFFQHTIDDILAKATGDVEVVPVIDGYVCEPPLRLDDKRIKPIFLKESIGQRAAYNLGVKESTGDYVMKLDAHAMVSPGFDEVLSSYCPPKTIVLPEMRRLNPHKWEVKRRGKTHHMFFGLDLYCHSWRAYKKRTEAKGEYPEVLTGQGSCWFTTREWNDYIGLLDEAVGSWGKVGIEVSLRTWLCGGRQILNRAAWQAHWFRVTDGGFTYPMSGRQVAFARDYTWNNYFFKDDAFENQVHHFKWLLDKFAPVPTWEVYMRDEYKAPRVIVYYTDSQLDGTLARAVRSRLKKVAGPIPIISVSQVPLDFGENINVGEKIRSHVSMYEQLLAGAKKAAPGSIIYLCEHDVFYHFSHFEKLPPDDRAFYFNKNRYYYREGLDTFLHADGARALSQAVVTREYLIEHAEKRLRLWASGQKAPFKMRWYTFNSERPNIDIRHPENLVKSGHKKGRYYQGKLKGVRNLPGWGGTKHFRSTVSYKGMSRTDIITFLIKRYKYKSYLEIGIKKNENFKHIVCDEKDGVDPAGRCNYKMTSDEFFAQTEKTYDLIFIDGLHEAHQVEKDLDNSLRHLNVGGVIVMHDCNPETVEQQQVPAVRGQRIWCGDVWKAYMKFRRRSDLEMYVVDTNNGVGVVRPGYQEVILEDDLSYERLEKNRVTWLNLKDQGAFKTWERERGIDKPVKMRKHIPIGENVMYEQGRTNTICQTLREIYFKANGDESLKLDIRVAMSMAKSMEHRLKKYKKNWDKDFWDDQEVVR